MLISRFVTAFEGPGFWTELVECLTGIFFWRGPIWLVDNECFSTILTTSNPDRQAIDSWARYLGLGTQA